MEKKGVLTDAAELLSQMECEMLAIMGKTEKEFKGKLNLVGGVLSIEAFNLYPPIIHQIVWNPN